MVLHAEDPHSEDLAVDAEGSQAVDAEDPLAVDAEDLQAVDAVDEDSEVDEVSEVVAEASESNETNHNLVVIIYSKQLQKSCTYVAE